MKTYHIFDLDGTLVDSMPYIAASILQVLDEDGIAYGPELFETVTPLGYPNTARLFQTMGVPGTVEEIVGRFMAILHHRYANDVPLKAGVAAYLHRLKAEGARLCVLTASPHLLTDVCLQHNGIYDLFHRVWSVEDFDTCKTDPGLFHAVVEQLHCTAQDICFYDDNLTACATAVGAGWYTCGVQDRQNPEILAQLRQTADRYIPDFATI